VQQLDQMPVKDDVITDDLDLDNPDPHKAAYAIRSDGRHTGTFQLGRLVSEALRAKGPELKYGDTAKYAMDVLKQGKPPTDPSPPSCTLPVLTETRPANEIKRQQNQVKQLDDFKKNIRASMGEILMLRRSDTAQHMANDIVKNWPDAKPHVDDTKLYGRDPKQPDKRILVFDKDETFAQTPGAPFRRRDSSCGCRAMATRRPATRARSRWTTTWS
jgi:hypothetical protein